MDIKSSEDLAVTQVQPTVTGLLFIHDLARLFSQTLLSCASQPWYRRPRTFCLQCLVTPTYKYHAIVVSNGIHTSHVGIYTGLKHEEGTGN